MSNKIERVREDIRRTEARIRELEEYLKTLRMRERQLCDDEVARVLREMAGKGGDVLEVLNRLRMGQDRTVPEEGEVERKHV